MPYLTEQQFVHLNNVYNQALNPLYAQIDQNPADQESLAIAANLVQVAKHYSINQAWQMIEASPMRNLNTTPFVENPYIMGQPWADNADQPLEVGESWNQGRRATNIKLGYSLTVNDLPINPYLNFGLTGRGGLGRYGPNHAVDCGVLRVMPNTYGNPTLHTLGIIRADDGKKALCGGYTTFEQSLKGDYPYTKNDITHSQAHEFFEELVSGSVALLPQYAQNLGDIVAGKIALREITENKQLTQKERTTLERQIETELKVQQVAETDLGFLATIQNAFASATPCFAGPVLSSTRNTNNAWMETYLSWIDLPEATWQDWQKDSPCAYDFKAGDDAQAVMWHEINGQLIKEATPSHGAFFGFLLASYITQQTTQNKVVPTSLKTQALDVLQALNNKPILA